MTSACAGVAVVSAPPAASKDAGIGIKAGTIRADLTRNRWPEPNDTDHGVNRWRGTTATKALEGRRGYRQH
ncbi:hypothetical protein [Streptomyces sp. SP18BB07]|uniref:hypothetical protein n=1 Tax=Streptomyces sp. SP18BB07 TaxID=3002522 RepID=UPI002E77E2A2|nr:hypothetical protein [Streptomyces sp. SP18BB07]MEE1761188.1 hypothetical protein [Streptomyces sp. SP18BB07]